SGTGSGCETLLTHSPCLIPTFPETRRPSLRSGTAQVHLGIGWRLSDSGCRKGLLPAAGTPPLDAATCWLPIGLPPEGHRALEAEVKRWHERGCRPGGWGFNAPLRSSTC